jgi:DNA-binding NtrC family response regulator
MATTKADDRISTERSPFAGVKILVVGWDAASLKYYQDILEGMGLNVITRTSHAAGVACLDQYEISLVLLNQGSPAFEGRRIIEYIRANGHHTSVLVVTRQYDQNIAHEALGQGALGYLEEPVSIAKISYLIKTYFDTQRLSA